MIVHETSYQGRGFAAMIHRSRLHRCLRLFRELPLPATGRFADFGCSNGFIIEQLQRQVLTSGWQWAGFDHEEDLLALARDRQLPDTSFEFVDLNQVNEQWRHQFNIVACLETLEHVGNYRHALGTLHESCKPGGWVVISIPNERGLPGLVKFLGRMTLRRNPYDDFFEGKSAWAYAGRLLTGGPIEDFREPEAPGWGPHLGFDWRAFEQALQAQFLESGDYTLELRAFTPGRFNLFYVFRKQA